MYARQTVCCDPCARTGRRCATLGAAEGAPSVIDTPTSRLVQQQLKRLQADLNRTAVPRARPVSVRQARAELMLAVQRAIGNPAAAIASGGVGIAADVLERYLHAAMGRLWLSSTQLAVIERQAVRGSAQARALMERMVPKITTAMMKVAEVAPYLSSMRGTSGLGSPVYFIPIAIGAAALLYGLVAAIDALESDDETFARLAREQCARSSDPECFRRTYEEFKEQARVDREREPECGWMCQAAQASGIPTVVKVVGIGAAVVAGGYLLFTFWPAISGFTARTRGALGAREAAKRAA